MRVEDNSIGDEVDVRGPTTTVQGRCALATDTPPPMVAAILWERDHGPRGHSSCKQSRNWQEQVEQALKLLDLIEGSQLKTQYGGVPEMNGQAAQARCNK